MGPYDPPYKSPGAEWFAYHVSKYLDDMVDVIHDVDVPTICGNVKMGFVLTREDRRIGIEVGGDRFMVEFTDEMRDALILGTGAVDVIYHLRGPKLRERMEDVLYILLQVEPRFFSQRGAKNLERLVDPEIRKQSWSREDRFLDFQDFSGQDYLTSGLQRHSWEVIPKRHNCFREFYAFALDNPGSELDEIIRKWMKQSQEFDDF